MLDAALDLFPPVGGEADALKVDSYVVIHPTESLRQAACKVNIRP